MSVSSSEPASFYPAAQAGAWLVRWAKEREDHAHSNFRWWTVCRGGETAGALPTGGTCF